MLMPVPAQRQPPPAWTVSALLWSHDSYSSTWGLEGDSSAEHCAAGGLEDGQFALWVRSSKGPEAMYLLLGT